MSRIGLWPPGTSAVASSTHDPNFARQCACNRTYDAFNAFDGNPATFWNDDTPLTWPDTISLTVASGQEVRLKGLTVVSSVDGYIIDFDVKVFHNQSWTTTHQIRSTTEVQNDVSFSAFPGAVGSDGVLDNVGGVMITVLNSQEQFSRIAEIKPVYDLSISSASSVLPPTVSTTMASKMTTHTTTVTGVIDSNATATSAATDNHSRSRSDDKTITIGIPMAATALALLLAGAIYWFRSERRRRVKYRNSRAPPPIIMHEKPVNEKSPIITRVSHPPPPCTTMPSQRPPLYEMASTSPTPDRQYPGSHLPPHELSGQ